LKQNRVWARAQSRIISFPKPSGFGTSWGI